MGTLSDSLKVEVASVASTDSPHLISDQVHIRHLSTPDVSNIALLKRVTLLELENQHLRTDLENMRFELDTRIAANEGLKGKITELYVGMQLILQEKQKLQNNLTDKNNHLDALETSAKWYESQVHSLQASKKTIQLEIDTYQGILQQCQQTIVNINAKYQQLSKDYEKLLQQHQKEKQDLECEVQNLKTLNQLKRIYELLDVSKSNTPDIFGKLELTEEKLQNTRAELQTLEKYLLGNKVSEGLMKDTSAKQHTLVITVEENLQRCETEKNQSKTEFEIRRLKSENEILQTTVFSSKHERNQIEDPIFQLQLQLTKMITQYKLLKLKNIEAEEKLNSMQDVINENKRLKMLSYEANTVLIKKLLQEKQKVENLENRLHSMQMNEQLGVMRNEVETSLHECLRQVLIRNKDLKNQVKTLTKHSDESIDEGYADNSIVSSVSVNIPSPRSINPVLLDKVSSILLQSKDFCKPVQIELEHLKLKLNKLME